MTINEKSPSQSGRFWEIDVLRGVAILMMVFFHILFDLSFFGIDPVGVHNGFWRLFAITTASLFIFIAGVSFTISHSRSKRSLDNRQLYLKHIRRGLIIFSLGLAISIITWLVIGEGYVLFGILHLIGLSLILAPLFTGFRSANIILGFIVIVIGWLIRGLEGPIWLAWIGIHPGSFYSVDYEPLFPWFGLILMGMAAGFQLYPKGERLFHIPEVRHPAMRGLACLGRHSLMIYCIHQPVIILLLTAIYGQLTF